jgi:hypothetical protein
LLLVLELHDRLDEALLLDWLYVILSKFGSVGLVLTIYRVLLLVLVDPQLDLEADFQVPLHLAEEVRNPDNWIDILYADSDSSYSTSPRICRWIPRRTRTSSRIRSRRLCSSPEKIVILLMNAGKFVRKLGTGGRMNYAQDRR